MPLKQTLKYLRVSGAIRGDRYARRKSASRDLLALLLLFGIVGAALLALVHGR